MNEHVVFQDCSSSVKVKQDYCLEYVQYLLVGTSIGLLHRFDFITRSHCMIASCNLLLPAYIFVCYCSPAFMGLRSIAYFPVAEMNYEERLQQQLLLIML